MILAITDSYELAIVYAANIGGIMMGKLSVQAKNLDESMPDLKEKMMRDGYVSTFFRGEQHVFICAEKDAFSLSKLVDYNASYQDVAQRPVPFIPESFTYRCCDKNMEEHASLYKSLLKEASYIVNATTDSISGTLSFARFMSYFKVSKTVMRGWLRATHPMPWHSGQRAGLPLLLAESRWSCSAVLTMCFLPQDTGSR